MGCSLAARRRRRGLVRAGCTVALALAPVFGLHAGGDAHGTGRLGVDLARGETRVEFHATAWPTALRFSGATSRLDGHFDVDGGLVTGTAQVALDALETGIDLRDRHMRETYLETARYPTAVLELPGLKLGGASDGPAYTVAAQPFEGLLRLHGIQRAVRGTVRLTRRQDTVEVAAQFDVSMKDHGIEVPSYMGISVADKVRVDVRFSAALQPVAEEGAP